MRRKGKELYETTLRSGKVDNEAWAIHGDECLISQGGRASKKTRGG